MAHSPVLVQHGEPEGERRAEEFGLGFKAAGAGPVGIVLEQFGALSIFDLKTGKAEPLQVRISGDLPEVRERMVSVGTRLTEADLSPNGARAVFAARGGYLERCQREGRCPQSDEYCGGGGALSRRGRRTAGDGSLIFPTRVASTHCIWRRRVPTGAPGAGVVKIPMRSRARTGNSHGRRFEEEQICSVDSRLGSGVWTWRRRRRRWWIRSASGIQATNGYRCVSGFQRSGWRTRRGCRTIFGAIHLWSVETEKVKSGHGRPAATLFIGVDKDGKYLYFTASRDQGRPFSLI